MKLTISEQERGTLFAILNSGAQWGGDGSGDALLVRDELYTSLRLDEFEREFDITKLSKSAKGHELSRAVCEHLVATIGGAGLNRIFARILAPVVRRARMLLESTKPKASGATP